MGRPGHAGGGHQGGGALRERDRPGAGRSLGVAVGERSAGTGLRVYLPGAAIGQPAIGPGAGPHRCVPAAAHHHR